ncbi:MAG: hypothetical protein AAGD43_35460 [Pseudomonadota bacterium]
MLVRSELTLSGMATDGLNLHAIQNATLGKPFVCGVKLCFVENLDTHMLQACASLRTFKEAQLQRWSVDGKVSIA